MGDVAGAFKQEAHLNFLGGGDDDSVGVDAPLARIEHQVVTVVDLQGVIQVVEVGCFH